LENGYWKPLYECFLFRRDGVADEDIGEPDPDVVFGGIGLGCIGGDFAFADELIGIAAGDAEECGSFFDSGKAAKGGVERRGLSHCGHYRTERGRAQAI
jgi:hypothetical protein